MKTQTERDFILYYPFNDGQVNVHARLEVEKNEKGMSEFSISFQGSSNNNIIAGYCIDGVKADIVENSFVKMFQSIDFLKEGEWLRSEAPEPITQYIRKEIGIRKDVGSPQDLPEMLYFSSSLSALCYVPNVPFDIPITLQLLQKLGSCIKISLGYRNLFDGTELDLERDFNVLIDTLVDNFEVKNKSIIDLSL